MSGPGMPCSIKDKTVLEGVAELAALIFLYSNIFLPRHGLLSWGHLPGVTLHSCNRRQCKHWTPMHITD